MSTIEPIIITDYSKQYDPIMPNINSVEQTKVDFKVVINEVVELAKKYGEQTSHSFINGILASVVKEG